MGGRPQPALMLKDQTLVAVEIGPRPLSESQEKEGNWAPRRSRQGRPACCCARWRWGERRAGIQVAACRVSEIFLIREFGDLLMQALDRGHGFIQLFIGSCWHSLTAVAARSDPRNRTSSLGSNSVMNSAFQCRQFFSSRMADRKKLRSPGRLAGEGNHRDTRSLTNAASRGIISPSCCARRYWP